MSAVACPYCRAAIKPEDQSLACEGCGTVHHTECYAENCGCTIFGCSKSPADEPKLSVSAPELVAAGTQPPAAVSVGGRAAPPPRPGGGVAVAEQASSADLREIANSVVPSIFGGFGANNAESPAVIPAPQPKSRTTFIVLGVLLGAFGAHSFFAGYKKKGAMQLAITVLSLGFASPMSWVWAVIDICTINQDNAGVQFEA